MSVKFDSISKIKQKDKEKYGAIISEEISSINASRSYILLWLTGLIELGLFLGYDLPYIIQNGFSSGHIIHYSIVHSLLAIFSFIAIYFVYGFNKNGKFYLFPNASFKTLQAVYLSVFISGIAYINSLDQLITNSLSIYITFIIIVAVITILDLKTSLITFLIPHTVFVIGMFVYQDDAEILVFNLINGTTFMLTCLAISIIMYNNYFNLSKNRLLLKRANEKLAILSNTDSLTKIYNRRFGMRRLNEEISRANRSESDLGVILIDIDDFKNINDTYGHVAGDHVLVEFTKLISSHLRKEDIFIRYGGEEFLIVLPETNKDGVSIASEKIRRLVEKHKFTFQEETFHITVSLGGVVYPKPQFCEVESLIDAADKKLYESKNTGKNKFSI